MRLAVLTATMAVMVVFGGFITAGIWATDEPEHIAEHVENAIEADVVELEEPDAPAYTGAAEELEPELDKPDAIPEYPEVELEWSECGYSPADIIDMQTGLHVDYIKTIDTYSKGDWAAYYVHSDGDIYVITIKRGTVDVVAQLN